MRFRYYRSSSVNSSIWVFCLRKNNFLFGALSRVYEIKGRFPLLLSRVVVMRCNEHSCINIVSASIEKCLYVKESVLTISEVD